MQPTFLPWAGYFQLIAQADVFVFLDDAQFEKQSWQSRNRVLVAGASHWVSAPVHSHLGQTIARVQIDDSRHWRKKLLRTLEQAYARHPFRGEALESVAQSLAGRESSLSEFNINLILRVAKRLELQPRFERSSSLGISGGRSERLLSICEHFGCDEYQSPAGAAEYLVTDGCFADSSVRLTFQNYTPGPYRQQGAGEFVSHLSWVDVVANLGWREAAEYARTGLAAMEMVAA